MPDAKIADPTLEAATMRRVSWGLMPFLLAAYPL